MKNFYFVRTLKNFLLCATLFGVFLYSSCNQIASVPTPEIPGATSGAVKSIIAPSDLSATNGRKRKIIVEWTPVSNAHYYEIYYSDNPTNEFSMVGYTSKSLFEDSVSAGKTGYYKIRSVSTNGERSDFSRVVKGTSLAAPLISGGDIKENSVTIYWYMENARDFKSGVDNYESLLRYTVTCENQNADQKFEETLQGRVNSYTFENLDNNSEYIYYITAYLLTDQSNTESSAKVTATTLTSYIPNAPVVVASQGSSSTGIKLSITLPQKVTVYTTNSSSLTEPVDTEYPLCFKIERKLNYQTERDYEVVESCLFFNKSTTTKPSDSEYETYTPGEIIDWTDTSAKLQGGVKYDYKVTSYVDCEYNSKRYNTETHSLIGTVATGWKSAHPKFDIQEGSIDKKGTEIAYTSYSFKFGATWNDLGKAPSYKFAIKENRKKFDSDNGGVADNVGTDNWVLNAYNETLFSTIDEINGRQRQFDLSTAPENVRGTYTYSLYIVPAESVDAASGVANALDFVEANTQVVITDKKNAPVAELDLVGGYTNKIEYKFVVESGVFYTLTRKELDEKDGNAVNTEDVFTNRNDLAPNFNENEKAYFKGEDTGVVQNKYYSYVLKASDAGAPSLVTKAAATLGKPDVKFNFTKMAYDSVTVEFDGVVSAEKYVISIGGSGEFGGGETIKFDFDENKVKDTDKVSNIAYGKTSGSEMSADVKYEGGHFIVTISKPYGYNNAVLAGKSAGVLVTAQSAKDSATSDAVSVNVMGPALIDLQSSAVPATESITVSWNELPNATGYIVWRKRPAYGKRDAIIKRDSDGRIIPDTYKKTDAEIDYYYVAKTNKMVGGAPITLFVVKNYNGEEVGSEYASLTLDGGRFVFEDKYKKSDDATNAWKNNQEKIAWGLRYEYTVVPVLAESDAQMPEEFEAEIVKYSNLNVANNFVKYGYTKGYGLDLTASKADYADRVKLTWTIPEYGKANSGEPVIFYRQAMEPGVNTNTKAWTMLAKIPVDKVLNKNDETIDDMTYSSDGTTATCFIGFNTFSGLESISRTDCAEFAVIYGSYDEKDFKPSYISYLTNSGDVDDYKEDENCGYMFTLPDTLVISRPPVPSAGSQDDDLWFNEIVKWTLYSKKGYRARGPSGYTLYVKNLNCSSKWFPVATYKPDGTMTQVDSDWYNVDIEKTVGSQETKIKPKGIGTSTKRMTRANNGQADAYAGTHEGLLKVQRDYKHYYKLEAKRTPSFGGDDILAVLGGTDSDYAYRKITDDEFVKGITLIIADATHRCGIPSAAVVTTTTATLGNYKLIAHNYKIEWGTDSKDYTHKFIAKALVGSDSELVSGWTINAPMKNEDKSRYGVAGSGCWLYSLAWNDITVKHETGLSSYQGTMWVHVGKPYSGVSANYDRRAITFDLSIQYSHSGTADANKVIINGRDGDTDKDTNFTYNSSYDTSYTVSNNSTKFYEWFPYQLARNGEGGDKTVNLELQTYRGNWYKEYP